MDPRRHLRLAIQNLLELRYHLGEVSEGMNRQIDQLEKDIGDVEAVAGRVIESDQDHPTPNQAQN